MGGAWRLFWGAFPRLLDRSTSSTRRELAGIYFRKSPNRCGRDLGGDVIVVEGETKRE